MRQAGFDDFSAFVAARQRSLLRTATLLTGDRHRAQDLVQDALVKLATRWHVVGPGHPEAFVRRVMYRDAISWRRKHWREQPGGCRNGAISRVAHLSDPGDTSVALAPAS